MADVNGNARTASDVAICRGIGVDRDWRGGARAVRAQPRAPENWHDLLACVWGWRELA